MRLDPSVRVTPDTWESSIWARLQELQSGDVFVDVGAHMGLYAIAAARRVGERGCVFAFEPSPANRELLGRHAALNGVEVELTVIPAAVGDTDGTIQFDDRWGTESHVATAGSKEVWADERVSSPPYLVEVPIVRLDTELAGQRVDVLKIDVEGFEQQVLQGAEGLLSRDTGPRMVLLELHPYAWPAFGGEFTVVESILQRHDYELFDSDGRPFMRGDSPWPVAVIARRNRRSTART